MSTESPVSDYDSTDSNVRLGRLVCLVKLAGPGKATPSEAVSDYDLAPGIRLCPEAVPDYDSSDGCLARCQTTHRRCPERCPIVRLG